MRITSSQMFHRLSVALMLLLVGMVLFTNSESTGAQTTKPEFNPHPLTNASAEEIAQVAINLTEAKYPALSGTPQVLLTRSVTLAELPALGLGSYQFGSIEEPPLVLVVVKGDFDTRSKLGLAPATPQATHIGYVFDLWAGIPTVTIISPKGGAFRNVLNDPTLPEDTPGQAAELDAAANSPAPPELPYPKKLHYGETAPPANPAAPEGK